MPASAARNFEVYSFSGFTLTTGSSAEASIETTIGRQQTSQSSTYCWLGRVASINSSTDSPQYGHRTDTVVTLKITATPFTVFLYRTQTHLYKIVPRFRVGDGCCRET